LLNLRKRPVRKKRGRLEEGPRLTSKINNLSFELAKRRFSQKEGKGRGKSLAKGGGKQKKGELKDSKPNNSQTTGGKCHRLLIPLKSGEVMKT